MPKKTTESELLKQNIGDKIHKICKRLKIPNPLEFTISVMAGVDPRPIRKQNLVLQELLDEIGGTPPSSREWRKVRRLTQSLVDAKTTSLSMSHNSAKQLLEYSFAKKKAETLDINVVNTSSKVTPLTPEEVEQFQEKFNSGYV